MNDIQITRTQIEDALNDAWAEQSRGGTPQEFSDAAIAWLTAEAANTLYDYGNRNEHLERAAATMAVRFFLAGFRLGVGS